MRKLASVKKIDSITPIRDADVIECAHIGGWAVVVKKGEFREGDLVVYFEIDSWIPHVLAPFLSKGQEPRVYEGIKGERLRTIKLRGQISQGLILPLTILHEGEEWKQEGTDVTELLGIIKWEPPDVTRGGEIRGNFPSFIPKTDQERCQNLVNEIFNEWWENEWEVTMKLDGSSITVFYNEGDLGVCSRNLNLKLEETEGHFVKASIKNGLLESLPLYQRNIAIQGEIMGPGIQGNPEKMSHHQIFVFDIFDIDNQKYLSAEERKQVCVDLNLNHVPIIKEKIKLRDLEIKNINDLISFAEGPGMNSKSREGVVFKECNGKCSFKSISNKYLLKTGS